MTDTSDLNRIEITVPEGVAQELDDLAYLLSVMADDGAALAANLGVGAPRVVSIRMQSPMIIQLVSESPELLRALAELTTAVGGLILALKVPPAQLQRRASQQTGLPPVTTPLPPATPRRERNLRPAALQVIERILGHRLPTRGIGGPEL